MEQYIYLVTAILYCIFIIRFILSWVGGDFDLDVDADLDLGDLVSFKGITHFLMGAGSWLSLKMHFTHAIMWYDYLIALGMGFLFFGVLLFVYKLMCKLEHKPTLLTGKDLIGQRGTIFLKEHYCIDSKKYYYVVNVNNGFGTIEVKGISEKEYNINDCVLLVDFTGTYYILN